MLNNQLPLNEQIAQRYRNRWREYPGLILLGITLSIVAGLSIYGAYRLGFGAHEISVDNDRGLWGRVAGIFSSEPDTTPTPTPTPVPRILKNDSEYIMPTKEKNRLDILVMGMRGADDPDPNETGALLTDTMMILSINTDTGAASLVSIPRDLYIIIGKDYENKLNTVYEIGLARKQALDFSKQLFSKITGIYVDHVIVFDFSAFKKIVDDLGGIDITLDAPFVESGQWGYPFELPEGANHLNGEQALYFVRSRYSSSDFDRAQRQQKVILAIKEKIKSLNLLKDPGTGLTLLNTARQHIHTDLNIWDAPTLVDIGTTLEKADGNLKRSVLTTDNLPYETHAPTGAYILLPKGDSLADMKKHFQTILGAQ